MGLKKRAAASQIANIHSVLNAGKIGVAKVLIAAELRRSPRNPSLLGLLGVASLMSNELDVAESCLKKAISIHADAVHYMNLAIVYQKKLDESKAEWALLECLRLDPKNAKAANNLGNIYRRQTRLADAERLYRQSISSLPGYGLGYLNLGAILSEAGKNEAAIPYLEEAVKLLPESRMASSVLAGALYSRKRFSEAAQYLESAEDWCFLQLVLRAGAIWSNLDKVDAAAINLLRNDPLDHSAPWGLINLKHVTPELHREAGRRFAQFRFGAALAAKPLAKDPVSADGILRVGYLSCDFYDHATMHLLIGVLEQHDGARVDFQLFNYGLKVSDEYTRRLDRLEIPHHDLSELSDERAAAVIAAEGLHILVDLKGYTTGARLGICARRPAPVIVSWLGYPGSLGHPGLADYIIGDPIVTPTSQASHYSEKIAQMPICYQPNGRGWNNEVRGDGQPPRATKGTEFVFCNFNQILKFNPEEFELWCYFLKAVPGSVLWILDPDVESVRENLRREMTLRNVKAERLVFCSRLSQQEHLRRLALADLALDCYPCTSHTTASDYLWAGVPFVARMGDTFASRVSASLLHAHGFSELVVKDQAEYIQKVICLARDKAALNALRQRLQEAKNSSALFDVARFTSDLENLYFRIWMDHSNHRGECLSGNI
ncbi:tetratricopeptide repeat protein [Pseudomonas mosselii]|uniref:tetratricopeptide repeat protein n=1 Tax=Pseudomonas mosselii TaxID=78327 RepID=UPI003F2FEE1D